MSRTPRDAEPDLPSEGPACPQCGGGPVVDVLGSRVCRSCARVLGPAARDVTTRVDGDAP